MRLLRTAQPPAPPPPIGGVLSPVDAGPARRLAAGRALAWGLFALVAFIDWGVASPLSLSLLYGLPLALAAFRLGQLEVALLVLLSTASRVALSPNSGWKFAEGGLRLPVHVEPYGNVVGALIAYSAIAALVFRMRKQEQRLAALGVEVLQDPLTGLGNRRALLRCLERHAGRQVAVLALDLDHFKRVNDAYGHAGGDLLLVEVAERLLASVRGGDCVARTGGEEFVVVLPGESGPGALSVAQRIVDKMHEAPFPVGHRGERTALTVSIGFTTGAAHLRLVEEADRALYRAKAAGRDRIELAPEAAA